MDGLVPKGHYCRLFEPASGSLPCDDEEKLLRLGEAMRYTVEREGTLTPRVGFTYLGQFIGHDLTHDVTPLRGPYASPEGTPNYRTPFLNLEQLYGGGPGKSSHLYEGDRGAETFKIGRTTGLGYARDLSIEDGKLRIADERNLDNLILRQLHVAFLRFHNEAVRQLAQGTLITSDSGQGNSETVFERARRLVRWHYQWVVRHDFLPRILHNSYWSSKRGVVGSYKPSDFSIPVEFSLAAFRYGHSMVRNAYGLNCRRRRVELAELMALGRTPQTLTDDLIIEWGRFFDGLPRSGPVASSSYLDTSVARPLHGLSRATLRLCIPSENGVETTANLPIRTLLRGARARLPSGQQVAIELQKAGFVRPIDSLTPDQLTTDTCNAAGSVLKQIGLHRRTPLFYYVLKEAELLGLGQTLGPVGSAIVGGVIERALGNDPDGYLCKKGPRWMLPLWDFPNGEQRTVNSFISLVRLIRDAQLLPDCQAHLNRLLLRPRRCASAMASAWFGDPGHDI